MNKGRKITGGKYHSLRKKKLFEKRGQDRHVVLWEEKIKNLRIKGGKSKNILLKSNMVNICSSSKTKRTLIKNVLETRQNKFFARQNRLMKGAIIETDLGKARITNRPSQEGCINAVLITDN